jgi:actin-like ATPase involved in cell morphogenesis
MYDPLGLSIGTTNLVAARNGSPPVSRRAVLTLYPHCAPRVGVLGENSNLAEPGTLMSGFVERVGDSVALVSPDGSAHDPDLLMVEALDAMLVAAGADASSSEITIAVPAQWKPGTVQALRNGLRTHVGFVRSGMAPCLVPDTIAAMTAVNSELGIPAGGMVGLLDFGGSGTYATLMETKVDFEPLSATMRYEDFSGNQIDQALLLYVIDELGHEDIDPASTSAASRLGKLREECREAKERLSTDAVTELAAELSGSSTGIQITRKKLDDLIQDRLTGFIYAFDDMLARNRAGWADLAAVVAVGGGASIPLVTQRLSLHTRLPVLTVAQPACAAATGALVLATRGGQLDLRTRTSIGLMAAAAAASGSSVIELPAGDVMVIDQDALTDRELAWSQTEFPGDVPVRFQGDSYNEDIACWSMRLNLIEPPKEPPWRRLRVSQLLIGLCAVVAMTAIGGVAFTLTAMERRQAPAVPSVAPLPAPPTSIGPSSIAPSLIAPSPTAPNPMGPPPSAAPVPSAAPAPTSVAPPPPPPPSPVVTTRKPPPVTTTTTTPPPITATTTTPEPQDTTTDPPTSTVKMTTEWLHVPLIPVPIPIQVPQNQAPQNPVPQTQSPQNPFLSPGTQ